ncbi:MAG: SGNH/GDSL hydrolase family protein [Bacteroidetes bacterium]|nr:SGNH/GDSL hydrolase family protein [Bacteroidota bacterium]
MSFHYKLIQDFILFGIFASVFSFHHKNLNLEKQLNEIASKPSFSYLALGDSYTIGESVKEAETYTLQTVKLLGETSLYFSKPEVIARTGWTTADLQKAIDKHHFQNIRYKIVTLLIGVNNQYQGRSTIEYTEQFKALLTKSIQLAGGNPSHVIVISIPDYGVTPFAESSPKEKIAKVIDSFNLVNYQISQQYKTKYLDITPETRKAANDHSLLASDGLHYSGKEYAIWAQQLSVLIKKIIR